MRRLIILSVILCTAWVTYGQRVTHAGETITYNGVTLNRKVDEFKVKIFNPKDTKMYLPYVLLNGQPAPLLQDDYNIDGMPASNFDQAARMTFTPTELARYKGTSVRMYLAFNNSGALIEVVFYVDSDRPLAHIPLQKYVLWTQNLKRCVRVIITDPETKKLQFVHGAMFYKMP